MSTETAAEVARPALTPDLDHLRALAQAATPGPWFVDYAGDVGAKRAIIADVLRERYGNNALGFGEDHATAEYVAALDPSTALALVDEITRLRSAIAEVADLCERWDIYSKGPTGTTTAIRERLGIEPPAVTRGRR